MSEPSTQLFFLEKIKPLEGKYVCLEPFTAIFLSEDYVGWFNDPHVCRYTRHGTKNYTLEHARDYLAAISKSNNTMVYAIIEKERRKHIGNISLNDISWANHSGEISLIIGDRNYWGKGIGKEAVRLIIDLAFSSLKLHRVWVGMTADNAPMIRLAQSLGFSEEGRLKDALYKNGSYFDITQWSKINSESK